MAFAFFEYKKNSHTVWQIRYYDQASEVYKYDVFQRQAAPF